MSNPSTNPKKTGNKAKHGSLPANIEAKFKNILPATIRGSATRKLGSQTTKVGAQSGTLEPEALGGGGGSGTASPSPLGGPAATRAVRARATSGASSVSEKSKSSEPVLHEGFLKKKGVINTMWKARYFALTNKNLYYWEKEPLVPPDGSVLDVPARGRISLDVITSIEKDTKARKNGESKFNVNTATRIYRLQTFNEENDQKKAGREMDGWIGSIAGAIENFKQMNAKRRKESGSSLEWIKEHEKVVNESINISIQPTTIGSTSGQYEPARLANWMNWSAFDVAAWLYKLQLSKVYSEIFYENKVDGEKLKTINKDDLESIGVTNADDQMKILNAVEELKTYVLNGGI